jgi:hypothetical protein
LPQGDGSAAGLNWTGNLHPEVIHFSVAKGTITYAPPFIGNSVPTPSEHVCVPKYTILRASYCGEDEPAVTHEEYRYITTPEIPATDEKYIWVGYGHGDYVWISDVQAYYEIVYGGPYDGKCKIVNAWDPHDFEIQSYYYTTYYKITSSGPLKYRHHDAVPGHYKNVGYHYGDYSYTPATPGTPAVWSEWSTTPAPAGSTSQEQTITDVSAKQGGCAYPTEELQSVVDRGIISFLFDNRPAEGGIFDAAGSELLAPIEDPAPNIQKHVSITYNTGCGAQDKTIEAMEYEVINL